MYVSNYGTFEIFLLIGMILKRMGVAVPSNGILSTPNFVKICPLVQTLRQTHIDGMVIL